MERAGCSQEPSSMLAAIRQRQIPGTYWLAEYQDVFWPSIIFSSAMIPDHLIRSRPVDSVVPVLLIGKLEFIWAKTATLLPYEPSNLSILADQTGNEELCQAYEAIEASDFAGLDYWSDHLRDHLLAKSLRDLEAEASKDARGEDGGSSRRLHSNEIDHSALRAAIPNKRKISDKALGKMSQKKARLLGLLHSSGDAEDDYEEDGEVEHATAEHAQEEDGGTDGSLELESEMGENEAQFDEDIKDLEIVLPYTTVECLGESSRGGLHGPDPNIVTIYVGKPGKGFQVLKEVVLEHPHLRDCIVWDKDVGLRMIRRPDSKIDPAEFFYVAEFFTFREFEPRLINRGTDAAHMGGLGTDSARTDAMRTCATVFRVARQMLLPYLIELTAEKFEALRPWSAADIVMVAEIVLKKDCTDLDDGEDFRTVLIQHLASHLWDFDRGSQHRLRDLMEADPYIAKALLGRMFSLSMAAHRDRKLRERADSGVGIESEKE